ncbi:MAG: hypothetical protein ACE5EH_11855 [Gammaproteobacteria bacterium]
MPSKSPMSPLELANKYLEIFYSGTNLEDLKLILSPNFRFRGPLFKFDLSEDYINTLKQNPPDGLSYKIMHAYEEHSSACIVYEFIKDETSTPMAQVFEVSEGKITNILLLFDSERIR